MLKLFFFFKEVGSTTKVEKLREKNTFATTSASPS